jgi:hypothetical protein
MSKKIGDSILMYILMNWPSVKIDRPLIMSAVAECQGWAS